MSSGQKAWEEEREAQARKEHHDRIAQLGPSEIIKRVKALTTHFKYLEEIIPSLPRNGWYRIDEIKKLLKELS